MNEDILFNNKNGEVTLLNESRAFKATINKNKYKIVILSNSDLN